MFTQTLDGVFLGGKQNGPRSSFFKREVGGRGWSSEVEVVHARGCGVSAQQYTGNEGGCGHPEVTLYSPENDTGSH